MSSFDVFYHKTRIIHISLWFFNYCIQSSTTLIGTLSIGAPGNGHLTANRCSAQRFPLFFHCNTLYQTMNASKAARHMTKHSKIVKPAMERLIPRFVFEELKIGKLLGSGGFNQVYEVTSVTLLEEPYMHECATKICSENQTALRTAASQRADESRFAIKFLSQETMNDPDRFYTGAADLAIEAKFLANLMHPDIIQLRGMSAAGTNGFASCQNTGFFLVLDALQCTLEDRLEEWSLSEEMKSTLSSRKLFGRGASKRKAGVLADRLDVAACVASALEYLHEQNIICKFLCLRSLLF
jgi:serine/threonine protein kinase